MAKPETSYSGWSPDALIERVQNLEKELQETRQKYGLRERAISNAPSTPPRPTKKPRIFDWSKYTTRFIALKFAYLGKRYNGFEHHANNTTPLPTVEETLWKALTKACLISPQGDVSSKRNAIDWEGCDYSKCGRTDRGVNAFGQVIGLRVRSNRPPKLQDESTTLEGQDGADDVPIPKPIQLDDTFDDIADEMPYLKLLNNLLPSDIRMLAWCPSPPPNFSARFSCRERRYRYFFTQPAIAPTPGQLGFDKSLTSSTPGDRRREGYLDIDLMQQAARRFEGLHDFRNFCKIDGSKQISDFRRRIFHSEIRALTPSEEPAAFVGSAASTEFAARPNHEALATSLPPGPKTYVFDLRGSAFLWHQVRHMVAILFLIGQGLEPPETIDRLLDVAKCSEKPIYEMADDTPLVLWDCIFPAESFVEGGGDSSGGVNRSSTGGLVDPSQPPSGDWADLEAASFHSGGSRTDSLRWIYPGQEPAPRSDQASTSAASLRGRFGVGGLLNETWRLWHTRKIEEILAGSLANLAAQGGNSLEDGKTGDGDPDGDRQGGGSQGRKASARLQGKSDSQRIFLGGDEAVYRGAYVPVMQRARQKSAAVLNREYAEKHGLVFDENGRVLRKGGGEAVETRRDHVDE